MRNRRSLLALLGVAAALFLSACGGTAPAAPQSSRSTPAKPSAPAAASTPSSQQAKQAPVKLTMRLDWIYQGPNIGFVVARSKGFYQQAGLDVTVLPGKGSGTTAQLIANGSNTFGFADGYVVANSVAKGMPIKMVASIYRRNPSAIEVLASSPIKTVKELEGKSVGIAPGSGQAQQWPAFIKGCHLDGSKIHRVSVQPASAPQALLSGKVDAIAGYAQGYVPTIEVRGHKQARIFWYSDCGVTAVSNGIIARDDYIQAHPAVVRKFVAASIRGFLYARQHPSEAIQILKTYSPTIDPAITKVEMPLSWQTWVTPNTRGKPLGWMSPKDWAATLRILHQYGGVANPPKPGQVYTDAFVPAGAAYVPPQGG